MAQNYELKATVRERVGKGAARALRREGLVPAVIYGDKKSPIAISIPSKETTLRLHGGGFLTHVVTIDVDGEKIDVIPRDYQLDPVKDTLVHVDYLRVSASSKLTVDIPVHFLNQDTCPGIKRGGVLNIVRHEVEMEVSADAIPEYIEVDLAGAEVGDSIHISAVTLPKGARPVISDRDFTIATIAAPAALKSEEAGADAEADTAE
ncbi:50S ribosomal protein L25/general stress protein Ctc [Methylobrevis pamukkalensis]|uniref:Large ribosomal subunit protein bL25 n=1 Tax=Methylobrevis pamukkalensis TaxID=1439726 RepID=A0A1E3H5B4_9HYPH|nr:50S ribosomal protein L25/general stress protein Ctc [Methylobrevis pamukkalensis]ODN71500.1 50S ribosomal protein L25 [Methylobrevis pamukkalensis]